MTAILAQPDFVNTSTKWNFYLVSSEYDAVVKQRITQEGRPTGLFVDKPNHRVWVKSWAELLRDCEARLKFVQDQLRIEVSAEEIEERITKLKASILKATFFTRRIRLNLDAQSPRRKLHLNGPRGIRLST